MSDIPTLHLTNWSSTKLHGPGRKLTIMANPRHWEWGDGRVSRLVPDLGDLNLVLGRRISIREYQRRYVNRVADAGPLGPGDLWFTPTYRNPWNGYPKVEDGDTLCACSREAAAKGECHRVWAARFLMDAGWRVLLDGEVGNA